MNKREETVGKSTAKTTNKNSGGNVSTSNYNFPFAKSNNNFTFTNNKYKNAKTHYIPINEAKATSAFNKGVTIQKTNSVGAQTLHQKNGRYLNDPRGKRVNNTLNSRYGSNYGDYEDYTRNYDKADYSKLDYTQLAAYGRDNGWTQEQFQSIADAVNNPGSDFYNPYFKGAVVQNKAADYLREYFNYDGPFDADFFQQTSEIQNYLIKDSNTTLNASTPSSKTGTPEQWAAYYWVQLQDDLETQNKVNQQWSDLRTNAAASYKSFETIYGRKPTYQEFVDSIDMSKYSQLQKIDDSRNLDYNTSQALVQLNTGTYYSKESLAGLYYTLYNGGDISEDRDYTEDSILYWMSEYEEPDTTTKLAEMGYDVTNYTYDDYTPDIEAARAAGNHEAYEALKAAQYQAMESMDSIDKTDYLGERFGYYHDDAWFEAVKQTYGATWERMKDASGEIQKPNSSQGIDYQAAWQAWQIYKLKDDTDTVDTQNQQLRASIVSTYNDLSASGKLTTYKDFKAFIDKYVRPSEDSTRYQELWKYMQGDVETARTIFVSDEEIDAYIKQVWDSQGQVSTSETAAETATGSNVSPTATPEATASAAPTASPTATVSPTASSTPTPTSTPTPVATTIAEATEPEEVDPGLIYDPDNAIRAAEEAVAWRNDSAELGKTLENLAAEGATVPVTQWLESGIAIAPATTEAGDGFSSAVAAMWYNSHADYYKENLGENATLDQCASFDPVLKALLNQSGDSTIQTLTVGNVSDMLRSQTIGHMNNSELTISDGVIQSVIPSASELMVAIGNLSERYGAEAAEEYKQTSFDIAHYNSAYDLAKNNGYSGSEAAEVALDATLVIKPELDVTSAVTAGDEDLSNASSAVTDAVTGSDKYPDSVKAATTIAFGSGGKGTGVRGLAANIVLGLSDEATPAQAAATKDIVSEYASGGISAEDVENGTSLYSTSVESSLNNQTTVQTENASASETTYNDLIELNSSSYTGFGGNIFVNEVVDGQEVTVINNDFMTELRESDPEAADEMESKYNSNASSVFAETELPQMISEAAETYGHNEKIYGKSKKEVIEEDRTDRYIHYGGLIGPVRPVSDEYSNVSASVLDTANARSIEGNYWASLVSITGETNDDDAELTKFVQNISIYSNYFTPAEAEALSRAYYSGYITYDGVMSIIGKRTEKMSTWQANYNKNGTKNEGLRDDSDDAASAFFEGQREDAANYVAYTEAGYDDSALSELHYIVDSGSYDDLALRIQNAGMADVVGLEDGDSAETVYTKLMTFMNSSAVKGGKTGGAKYTDEQLSMLEKAYDLFTDLDSYGYDWVGYATKEQWKEAGVDFDSVGLTQSAETYFDEITNGQWRDMFDPEGVGFAYAAGSGIVEAGFAVGNILPTVQMWISKGVAAVSGGKLKSAAEDENSWYSRTKAASSVYSKEAEQKATNGEKLVNQIVEEFVRNRLTGALGNVLVNGLTQYSTLYTGVDAASSAGIAGTRAMAALGTSQQRAYKGANAALRVLQEMGQLEGTNSFVRQAPFLISSFGSEFEQQIADGKTTGQAFARSFISALVEWATETPEIESFLSSGYEKIVGNIKDIPGSLISWSYRTAQDVFNEIGQEELSLAVSKVLDAADQSGSDCGKFLKGLWSVLTSAETGEEAFMTAFTTMMTTLLGSVVDLGETVSTKIALHGYIPDAGSFNTVDDVTRFFNEAITAIDEAKGAQQSEQAQTETASETTAETTQDQSSESQPTETTTQTAEQAQESTTQESEAPKATGKKKKGGKPGGRRNKRQSKHLSRKEQAISEVTDALASDEITPDEAAEKLNNILSPQQGESTSKEATSETEQTPKTEQAASNENTQTEQQPRNNPAEPNTQQIKDNIANSDASQGAKKVANYMADSEEQKGEMVINKAKQQAEEKAVSESPEVQKARTAAADAAEATRKAEAKVAELEAQAEANNQRIEGVAQAATNENVDVNSPRVQGVISGIQQNTAAIQAKKADAQEKAQEARETQQKAEQAADVAELEARRLAQLEWQNTAVKLKELYWRAKNELDRLRTTVKRLRESVHDSEAKLNELLDDTTYGDEVQRHARRIWYLMTEAFKAQEYGTISRSDKEGYLAFEDEIEEEKKKLKALGKNPLYAELDHYAALRVEYEQAQQELTSKYPSLKQSEEFYDPFKDYDPSQESYSEEEHNLLHPTGIGDLYMMNRMNQPGLHQGKMTETPDDPNRQKKGYETETEQHLQEDAERAQQPTTQLDLAATKQLGKHDPEKHYGYDNNARETLYDEEVKEEDAITYGRMQDSTEEVERERERMRKKDWEGETSKVDLLEQADPDAAAQTGVDTLGVNLDFAASFKSLGELMTSLLNKAEKNFWGFSTQVPRKLYFQLMSALKSVPGGSKYVNTFFKHSTNSEWNADERWIQEGANNTIDRQKELYPGDLEALAAQGFYPVYVSTDGKGVILTTAEKQHKHPKLDEIPAARASPEAYRAYAAVQEATDALSEAVDLLKEAGGELAQHKRGTPEYKAANANYNIAKAHRDQCIAEKNKAEDALYEVRKGLGLFGAQYFMVEMKDVHDALQKIQSTSDALKVRTEAMISKLKGRSWLRVKLADGKEIEVELTGDNVYASIPTQELREKVLANTDFSNIPEEAQEKAKENINNMDRNDLFLELARDWLEKDAENVAKKMFGDINYIAFDAYSQRDLSVKQSARIRAEGREPLSVAGWVAANGKRYQENGTYAGQGKWRYVGTRQGWYVHTSLLALINRYRNALRKSGKYSNLAFLAQSAITAEAQKNITDLFEGKTADLSDWEQSAIKSYEIAKNAIIAEVDKKAEEKGIPKEERVYPEPKKKINPLAVIAKPALRIAIGEAQKNQDRLTNGKNNEKGKKSGDEEKPQAIDSKHAEHVAEITADSGMPSIAKGRGLKAVADGNFTHAVSYSVDENGTLTHDSEKAKETKTDDRQRKAVLYANPKQTIFKDEKGNYSVDKAVALVKNIFGKIKETGEIPDGYEIVVQKAGQAEGANSKGEKISPTEFYDFVFGNADLNNAVSVSIKSDPEKTKHSYDFVLSVTGSKTVAQQEKSIDDKLVRTEHNYAFAEYDGSKRFAMDTTDVGTLFVEPSSSQQLIQDSAGNFMMDKAVDVLKQALAEARAFVNAKQTNRNRSKSAQEANGWRVVQEAKKVEEKKSQYEIWVYMTNEDGVPIKKRVGARYWDTKVFQRGSNENNTYDVPQKGETFMPTEDELFKPGTVITVKNAYGTASKKSDTYVDFTIRMEGGFGTDLLKANLDSAENRFAGLFATSEQKPSKEDFATYAEAYLQAKAKLLNRELDELLRDYRLNGKVAGYNTESALKTYNAKQNELSQINAALSSKRMLNRYIEAYSAFGNGADAKTVQAAAQVLFGRTDQASPEVQAAIALAQSKGESAAAAQRQAEKQAEEDAQKAAKKAYKSAMASVNGRLRNADKHYPTLESAVFELANLRLLSGQDKASLKNNKAMQGLLLRMDYFLTQDMTPEERVFYYTHQADKAREQDATSYRYDMYQDLAIAAFFEACTPQSDETQESNTEPVAEQATEASKTPAEAPAASSDDSSDSPSNPPPNPPSNPPTDPSKPDITEAPAETEKKGKKKKKGKNTKTEAETENKVEENKPAEEKKDEKSGFSDDPVLQQLADEESQVYDDFDSGKISEEERDKRIADITARFNARLKNTTEEKAKEQQKRVSGKEFVKKMSKRLDKIQEDLHRGRISAKEYRKQIAQWREDYQSYLRANADENDVPKIGLLDPKIVVESEEDAEAKEVLRKLEQRIKAPIDGSFDLDMGFLSGEDGKPNISDESIAHAESQLESQEARLASAQADVNQLFNAIEKAKERAGEYLALQEKIDALYAKRRNMQLGTAEYAQTTHMINGLRADQIALKGGAEAYVEYQRLSKLKAAAVRKRNQIKELVNRSRGNLYGNKTIADFLKNRSWASAYGTVYGSNGKSPIEFARAVLNRLKKSGWQYGNITEKTTSQIAEAIAGELDENVLGNARRTAGKIAKTANDFKIHQADLEYEAALIRRKLGELGDEDITVAQKEHLKAYTDQVKKATSNPEDYKNYIEERNKIVTRATNVRDRLDQKYGKNSKLTEEELQRRLHALDDSLNGEIAQTRDYIANMEIASRSLFATGIEGPRDTMEGPEGGIETALDGSHGGRLPVSVVDLALGAILDVSEGKTGKDKKRVREGLKEIIGNYVGQSGAQLPKSFVSDVIDCYEHHYTNDEIFNKYEEKQRAADIIACLTAIKDERNNLLHKFTNPTASLTQLFDTPDRTFDFFFGDYSPLMRALFLDPAINAERQETIERNRLMKKLKQYKLNKKQRNYVVTAIENEFTEEDVMKEWPKDGEKIWNTMQIAKSIFETVGTKVNIAEKRNGLELTHYRKNYVHHGTTQQEPNPLLRALGYNRYANDVPIEIAGKTQDFTPVHKFSSAHLERNTNKNNFDIYESMQHYLSGALNTIYQTDNIVRMRQLSEALEGKLQGEQGVNRSFDYDQNGHHVGSRMAYLKQYFDMVANNMAGKDSKLGRTKNRNWTNVSKAVRSFRALALLAGNYKSALSNVQPLIKVAAMHPIEVFKALAQAAASATQKFHTLTSDEAVYRSNRYNARSSMSAEESQFADNVAFKALITPAELIDKFATNVLQRTLYLYEIEVNGSEPDLALKQAEKAADRLQASKTKLTRPELYNSPTWATVLQFTQESLNDIQHTIKDMPKYAGGNIPKAVIQAIFAYLLYSIYDEGLNSDSFPDIRSSVKDTITNRSESDTAFETAVRTVGAVGNTLSPYASIADDGFSGIPVIGGFLDIASAIGDMIDDGSTAEEWEELGVALLGFAPGGTQLRRTYTGIKDVKQGYSESSNGSIKFAIEGTPWEYAKAAVFGSSSLSAANDYVHGDYTPAISYNQTSMLEKFHELVDGAGLDATEALNIMLNGTSDAKDVSSEAKATAKDENATPTEIMESEEAASEARSGVDVPNDAATWAIEAVTNNPNSAIKTGIALWQKFNVKTYPTAFSIDEESGISDETVAAMESEYSSAYNVYMNDFNAGYYGDPNDASSAEALAKDLATLKRNILNDYTAQSNGGDE